MASPLRRIGGLAAIAGIVLSLTFIQAPQVWCETTPAANPAPVVEAIPLPPPPVDAMRTPQEDPAQAVEAIKKELLGDVFVFIPGRVIDPFAPSPAISTKPVQVQDEDEEQLPAEPQNPPTPLQRMSLPEIEKGLRAIVSAGEDVGSRRALIEDATGKGYIVGIGTPIIKDGVIAQIFSDRLIIRQEIRDRKSKEMIAQDSIVKLQKKDEKPY